MTYERLESRPNFYEFENGTRDEDVLDGFDELIKRMRRDLSGNLGYIYRTGVYNIPVDYFKELLKEYRDKYLLLGINLE